ncbi:MAG: porin [Bacteroidales bacterium]
MLKRLLTTVALAIAFMFTANSLFAQVHTGDSVRTNQYGKVVERVPLSAEARNGILVFESEDQSTKFWLDSRVYFDGAFFQGNTLNPIGNGVDIRRARFAVKADLKNNWYGEIDLDLANSAVELKDAIIQYNGKSWNIKGGHFKESFSMETTTTSRYVTFIERSLISKIAPSRHVGVQGTIQRQYWRLFAGVFGRTVGSLEEVTFAQDNNKDFGIDGGYSFTGKLVVNPVLQADKMLHLGAAGSFRTPKSDLEIPNSYRYSTRSLTIINRKKYIDTDDILNVENNTLTGVELAGYWNNIMFQTEYMHDHINRETGFVDANIEGFYAQAGILLFGGKYNYNSNEGEFTQVTRGKEWGDIELAFRFDYANANDFDAEVYGGAGNALTLGINYHATNNVKLMVNLTTVNHDRFANGKGKLYIYQDDAGDLYRSAFDVDIPKGKGGDDFSFIAFRVEVDF